MSSNISTDEELRSYENFDYIENMTINYYFNNWFFNIITSLACFNYPDNDRRECIATTFDLEIPSIKRQNAINTCESLIMPAMNRTRESLEKECIEYLTASLKNDNLERWMHSCKFNLNFSNYEAKESEINYAFSFNIIVTTLMKSRQNNKVFLDIRYTHPRISELFDYRPKTEECEKLSHLRIEVGKSM